MSEFIDTDDEIIDSNTAQDSPKSRVLCITNSETLSQNLIHIAMKDDELKLDQISPSDPWDNELEDVSLILLECRIIEAIQDLEKIKLIKQKRPLVPIIALSQNMDEEFIALAYETGIVDYLDVNVSSKVLHLKVRALGKLVKLTHLLEIKNIEVIDTSRTLREKRSELQQEKTSRIVAETEKAMIEEVAKLLQQNKEILDNLKEGFFVVLPDLSIDETTSLACEMLFENKIGGQSLGDSLNLIAEQENYIKLNMEQVFQNFMPIEVNIDLLPKQVKTKSNKIISLHYEAVLSGEDPIKVIVIASDITAQILEQEKACKRDKNNLCLINILKNYESFKQFVSDYEDGVKKIKTSCDLVEIKRIFHTLKGNLATYALDEISHSIHEIETRLKNIEVIDRGKIDAEAELAAKGMRDFLDDNIEVLRIKYLERHEKSYSVSSEMLDELKKIANLAEGLAKDQINNIIHLIKGVDLKHLISLWGANIYRLGEKLGKNIAFEYEALNVENFDFDKYAPLLQTLVHPITNACDHGIEPVEDRIQKGKPEKGTLKITIDDNPEKTTIVISDDGQGINLDLLVAKALEKQIITEDQLGGMSTQEKYHLMFHDGLSTAKEVSKTSGRGVGMAAMKSEIESLNGVIVVESKLNEGSTISLEIPKNAGKTYLSRGDIKILVCDDEPDIIELLQDLFLYKGYNFESASDGLDGLLLLSQKSYQLAIIDLKLPGINGKTIIKKIRSENPGGNKDIPIIVISGYIDAKVREEFSQMTNVHLINKPFSVDDLIGQVDSTFGIKAD